MTNTPSGPILHFATTAQRLALPADVLSEGQLAYVQEADKHYRWDGTTWDEFGEGGVGGGAPTDADYLVGTANGDLSAEIVVGTSPGGELGGTWASPTVDATHSGSTHSASTDTHIADAADAHDASAISVLDSAAQITATEVEGALAEIVDASQAHDAAADPHTRPS